jgi:Coenzyme PQQ synthesis protein D (PqqD)
MPNLSVPAGAETVLKIGPNISLQSMGEGEGGVLLRLDTGEMYTVNDTTLEFLQLVDGSRSIGSIVSSLLETFEVDEATLLADMLSIAAELSSESLVVPA